MEAENDKELEATIARVEKERKRQEKKERERKVKAELRAKMSVIASTDIYNQNDDVLFDRKTMEKLKAVDIEELNYEEPSEEEDPEGGLLPKPMDGDGNLDVDMDDASSIDDERLRFEQMAQGVDQYYENQKEYKMEYDRKLQKKEKKRK